MHDLIEHVYVKSGKVINEKCTHGPGWSKALSLWDWYYHSLVKFFIWCIIFFQNCNPLNRWFQLRFLGLIFLSPMSFILLVDCWSPGLALVWLSDFVRCGKPVYYEYHYNFQNNNIILGNKGLIGISICYILIKLFWVLVIRHT